MDFTERLTAAAEAAAIGTGALRAAIETPSDPRTSKNLAAEWLRHAATVLDRA